MAHYSGAWLIPPNAVSMTVFYNFTTGLTNPTGTWDLGGDIEWGHWELKYCPLPPMFEYDSFTVVATFKTWRTELRLTG